jgi:hypothetical protein
MSSQTLISDHVLSPWNTDQGWSLGVLSGLFCSNLCYAWSRFKVKPVIYFMHIHVFKQDITMSASAINVNFVISVDINIFPHYSLWCHLQSYIQRNFYCSTPVKHSVYYRYMSFYKWPYFEVHQFLNTWVTHPINSIQYLTLKKVLWNIQERV